MPHVRTNLRQHSSARVAAKVAKQDRNSSHVLKVLGAAGPSIAVKNANGVTGKSTLSDSVEIEAQVSYAHVPSACEVGGFDLKLIEPQHNALLNPRV